MREYLDPDVKADQCAQNVDDIGSATNNSTDLTLNIQAVFQCIRIAGLNPTIEKSYFGVRQLEFFGWTFSVEGVSPQTHKSQKFLNKLRFPKWKTTMKRYLAFVRYYRTFLIGMAEEPNPFHKLLKAVTLINITSELKETTDSVNEARDDCELEIKQLLSGKQLVLMTDASFGSSGIDLSIEENPEKRSNQRKYVLACGVLIKIFSPAELKMFIHSKLFLAFYLAILGFAHFLWETAR